VFYPLSYEDNTKFLIGTGSWQSIQIPDYAKMAHIILCGPGGNGGNGFTRAAGSAGGGGGGGGSGSTTTCIVPINIWMPKTLFFFSSAGGGGTSYICIYPSAASNVYSILTAPGGANGGNGSATVAGTAGAAGAVSTAASSAFSGLTVFNYLAGQIGVTGGAIAGGNGNSVTWGATGSILSSGAGGGGTTSADFAGGNITGIGNISTLTGGTTGSNNGKKGYDQLNKCFYFSGGSGGGSSNSGIGGNGGAGGPGCGGGGGGAGTTGGTGGLGGPGFTLVTFM
jgi:hypothetical protein